MLRVPASQAHLNVFLLIRGKESNVKDVYFIFESIIVIITFVKVYVYKILATV